MLWPKNAVLPSVMKRKNLEQYGGSRSWVGFAWLLCVLCLAIGSSGCGKGIQNDLEVSGTSFIKVGSKWRFQGTVKNTGNRSYSAVFLGIDLYEGTEKFTEISTSANMVSGYKLEPGQSTSFSQDFDDGGFKPNDYKVVRLYASR